MRIAVFAENGPARLNRKNALFAIRSFLYYLQILKITFKEGETAMGYTMGDAAMRHVMYMFSKIGWCLAVCRRDGRWADV